MGSAAAGEVRVGGARAGAVRDGVGRPEALRRGVRAPASAGDADRANGCGAEAYGSGGGEAYEGAAGVGGAFVLRRHGHSVEVVAGRPGAGVPGAVAGSADRRRAVGRVAMRIVVRIAGVATCVVASIALPFVSCARRSQVAGARLAREPAAGDQARAREWARFTSPPVSRAPCSTQAGA